MNKDSKILILGGTGLVGSAIKRRLSGMGYTNILSPPRAQLNLRYHGQVEEYFNSQKPEFVFLAAAKVGGIIANSTYPADFIMDNLMIQNNVIEACFKHKVDRLLFLGSSCVYPRLCPQPIKEEYLLTSALEPTNEPYAVAKIAGLKTAESFRKQYGCNFYSVMPTNLYGPYDNFDLKNSHVIPGLIHRMYLAKKEKKPQFEVWGSGKPRREFLYVDDMVDACIHIMNHQGEIPDLINIGCGEDITIKELAHKIRDVLGYKGEIVFNTEYPDGTPQKLLNIDRITNMGWMPKVQLEDGLRLAVDYFYSGVVNDK